MEDKLIAAIFGLIGGTGGAMIVPWAKWQMEKRKERYGNRKAFIEKVREQVIMCKKELRFFCTTPLYSQLRPHLSEELIIKCESETPPHDLYVQVLDFIHKLEVKWSIL